jgi:hypothetical protein
MLSINNLICGLELLGNRYHSLNVFIGDIDVDVRTSYDFEHYFKHEQYQLRFFPSIGVAQLTRDQNDFDNWIVDEVVDPLALGRGFGLLVGDPIGVGEYRPQRIFTLYFDIYTNKWQAYDGALVNCMKKALFLKKSEK